MILRHFVRTPAYLQSIRVFKQIYKIKYQSIYIPTRNVWLVQCPRHIAASLVDARVRRGHATLSMVVVSVRQIPLFAMVCWENTHTNINLLYYINTDTQNKRSIYIALATNKGHVPDQHSCHVIS